jgi:hypothetical protein
VIDGEIIMMFRGLLVQICLLVLIERTCKKVSHSEHLDIGSLRSGRDAICECSRR